MYVGTLPFLILVKFCKMYIPKKKAKNRAKGKKLIFLERDVIASYLSDLTRFQHRMKLQPYGNVPICLLGVFPYSKKRYKILKSNATDYYRRSSESRLLNGHICPENAWHPPEGKCHILRTRLRTLLWY